MTANKNKLIILLVLVLLAVIGSSVAIIIFLPDSKEQSLPLAAVTETPNEPVVSENPNSPIKFDLSVFQTTAYQLLNIQPIQDGSLPVLAPSATGKANPFL